jgi:hypothetical protein
MVRHVLMVLFTAILAVAPGAYFRFMSAAESIVDNPLRSDAGEYFAYAYNLRYKGVYSASIRGIGDQNYLPPADAIRSPGYPLFLYPLVDGLPSLQMIMRIVFVQTLLSVVGLLLCYVFFSSFLPRALAIGGCLLLGLSPHLIVANSYVLTESLSCFLLIVMGCAMVFVVTRPSSGSALLLGISIALANLVRPWLQFFPLLLMVFVRYQLGSRKAGLRLGLWMLLGFLVVFSPWLVRNQISLGMLSDRTLSECFVRHGMYPDFMFNDRKETYGYPYRFDPRVNQISSSYASLAAELQRRFREQPAKHLRWFFIGKPLALWDWSVVQGVGDAFVYPLRNSPYYGEAWFRLTHAIMRNCHGFLVLLMAIGSLLVWLPRQRLRVPANSLIMARFVSLFLMYFTLFHMIGFPLPRYAVPLRPFLYGMACFTPYCIYSMMAKGLSEPK